MRTVCQKQSVLVVSLKSERLRTLILVVSAGKQPVGLDDYFLLAAR
jgi:hypothetical protein